MLHPDKFKFQKTTFALVLFASIWGCKTKRSTIEVEDQSFTASAKAPSNTNLTSAPRAEGLDVIAEGVLPGTYLQVKGLGLPDGAKAYERVALTVSAQGVATQDIYDYTLGDTLDLVKDKSYSIVARTYVGEEITYATDYCEPALFRFKSKTGPNSQIVPLCAPAAGKATPDDNPVEEIKAVPIETP